MKKPGPNSNASIPQFNLDALLGVVAVDDAWGLLSFSLLMAAARMTVGDADTAWVPTLEGLWELGGAILIGGVLG